MIRDITVTIQGAPSSSNTTYDAEGYEQIIWTAVQTTEYTNKQPLSGEIAFNEYGITDAGVSHLFFFEPTSSVEAGGRIIDSVDTYDVFRVDKFPNHWEVTVKPVVS